jgi:hypothetical protein
MYHCSIDVVADNETHSEVNKEVVELMYAFVDELAAQRIG